MNDLCAKSKDKGFQLCRTYNITWQLKQKWLLWCCHNNWLKDMDSHPRKGGVPHIWTPLAGVYIKIPTAVAQGKVTKINWHNTKNLWRWLLLEQHPGALKPNSIKHVSLAYKIQTRSSAKMLHCVQSLTDILLDGNQSSF